MNYWDRKAKGLPPRTSPVAELPRVSVPVPVPSRTPQAPGGTNCPECGSPNYGAPTNGTAKRCFDCNFGSSYRNSTDNQPTVRAEGAVKAAKQIPTTGYDPSQIVGRLQ